MVRSSQGKRGDQYGKGEGAEAAVKLFATAFGFGFGWHAIVDEVAKWAGAFKDHSGKKE